MLAAVRRLLLLSSSTLHGSGYLDYCVAELEAFLGTAARVLFVPYATFDRDAYTASVRARLEPLGYAVDGIHRAAGGPLEALRGAEAVFVGGGNSFRLLDELFATGLVEELPRRVAAGLAYVGSSAGTNVACPTIRTTNDMPIVEPPSLRALGLIPFQINPHYVDPDPASTHMGETREQRIREFHEMNATPVLGLREGSWLRVDGGAGEVGGLAGARLFRLGAESVELEPGARIDALLAGG
jgi:dipeptidase E